MKKLNLLFLVPLFLYHVSKSADDKTKPIGRDNFERIEIDLKNGKFTVNKSLPFDVPFVLYGTVPKEVIEIDIYYNESASMCRNYTNECACTCDINSAGTKKLCTWKRFTLSNDPQTEFSIVVPPLKPNKSYRFCITVTKQKGDTEVTAINQRSKTILGNQLVHYFDSRLLQTDVSVVKPEIITGFSKELKTTITAMFPGRVDPASITEQSFIDRANAFDNSIDWSSIANSVARVGVKLTEIDSIKANIGTAWSNHHLLTDLKANVELSSPTATLSSKSKEYLDILLGTMPANLGQLALNGTYNISNMTKEPGDLRGSIDSLTIAQTLLNIQQVLVAFNTIQKGFKPAEPTLTNYLSQLIIYLQQYEFQLEVIRDEEKILRRLVNKVNVQKLVQDVIIHIPISGITTADFMTRSEYYITADLGFSYTLFDNPEIYPYAGVNFNFAPINRQARYRTKNYYHLSHPFWYVQSKNISMVIGITFGSVKNSINGIETRKGVIQGKSNDLGLLTAIAYRLGDFGRISFGAMTVKIRDANLLNNKYSLAAYPYFAISLDLDVKDKLGDLADLIFLK